MKIYCMSDIHGCLAAFEEALDLFEEHLEEKDTRLLLLGDYIHGGEDNYGVLDTSDTYEIFEIIGRKKGCLMKGGLIDYDKVIDIIINDIKKGKVKGITFDRFEDVK